LAKTADAQKMDGKGDEEDRGCDERTALREIWKECEEKGEQHQRIYRSWRLFIENAAQ